GLAPAALFEVADEAAVAVDAVVILDHRIDPDRFARRGDAGLDALLLPGLELGFGCFVERSRQHPVIRADPDMVFAGYVGDMINVTEQIFALRMAVERQE